jgi:transcriptional regulator with XRE-family HTH domain
MRETLGARLRQQREERQVSLAEIAAQTKIKASLLDGLERDDISQWPSGIFRKAYVRSYAVAIGFDPDAAVREFLAVYPDPVEVVESPPAPRSRLRSLVETAFDSLTRLRDAPSDPPPVEDEITPIAPPKPVTVLKPKATLGTVSAETVGAGSVPPIPALSPTETIPAGKGTPTRGSSADATMDSEAPLKAELSVGLPSNAETGAARAAATPGVSTAQSTPEVPRRPPLDPDLLAAARVCTELGRVKTTAQVHPLLKEASKILSARGLIVWLWDGVADELRPAFVHGYPSKVRTHLAGVRPDADNVTAEAFRAGETRGVSGTGQAPGALAVPLLTPGACAGVLAIELPHGSEKTPSVQAVATFFAAMLAQLLGGPSSEPSDGVLPTAFEARPG